LERVSQFVVEPAFSRLDENQPVGATPIR